MHDSDLEVLGAKDQEEIQELPGVVGTQGGNGKEKRQEVLHLSYPLAWMREVEEKEGTRLVLLEEMTLVCLPEQLLDQFALDRWTCKGRICL